jgi:hypothetical protein
VIFFKIIIALVLLLPSFVISPKFHTHVKQTA